MALTPYTSNDDVRALLGVTADELPDATLDLAVYSKNLRLEFDEVDPDLVTDFNTVHAIAEASRTTGQRRFYDAVELFAPAVVGVQVAPSLPLLAPKAITDGKAGITRATNLDFEQIKKNAKDAYDRYRKNLVDRYAEYQDLSATARTPPTSFLTVVSPATDPVTDDGSV